VPYGREDEGLHLPPVREALNRAFLDIKCPGAKDVPVQGFIFDEDASLPREVQPIGTPDCCLKESGLARFEFSLGQINVTLNCSVQT
jgi:hypothetical protein